MTYVMPDKIRFQFKSNNEFVQGLVVFFIFKSKLKNDFTVGPLVTGKHGELLLEKTSAEDVVSKNKSEFPMDYEGELSDCE